MRLMSGAGVCLAVLWASMAWSASADVIRTQGLPTRNVLLQVADVSVSKSGCIVGDVRSCTDAANAGDASAQVMLGDMYKQARGVPQDRTQAAKWYRLAADSGNAEAEFKLGDAYYLGHGVPEDHAEAVKWYRLAAGHGNAEAQIQVGRAYYSGDGVPEDAAEAVKWWRLAVDQYRLAADQGNAEAQLQLGFIYRNGGVKETMLKRSNGNS